MYFTHDIFAITRNLLIGLANEIQFANFKKAQKANNLVETVFLNGNCFE